MGTRSIKTRVALAAAALFIVAIGAVSALQLRFLREDFARIVSDQQFALASRMAREVDSKFETAQGVLAATARALPPSTFARPLEFRAGLDQHPALMAIFDDVLLQGLDGRIVADYPELAGRRGVDASDRSYYRRVMETSKPAISEPVISKVRREPIVNIAVPVFGADQKMTGILVGVIRLHRPNFLGSLVDERIGDDGYFALITRGPQPVYVVHPDRTRLLQPRRTDGADFVSQAIAGAQGSGAGTSSAGVENLYSAKLLRTVPWVLVAVEPKTEVFAPLQEAERRLMLVTLGAVILVMPLSWFMVWYLLAPLQRLRGAMAGFRAASSEFTPVPVARQDEVGDLTTTFNLLMERRLGAESARRESDARLRLVADSIPALISYVDADLRVLFANSCYREWFGIEPEVMIGRRLEDIFGRAAEETREPHETALSGYPATYEREVETLHGRRSTRTVLFPHVDEAGKVIGICRMTSDVSADKRIQRELDALARHDVLTGLHNRRSFEEFLPQAIARGARAGRALALLFIDLDRFKAVNDTLGHGAGDDVLKTVAARLQGAVRSTDTVARLAGDEFTVILESLHEAREAGEVAAKIIDAVQRPIATRAGEASVGASIGIATCEARMPADELIRRADEAVYAAKDAGRGCYRYAAAKDTTLKLIGGDG